MKMRYTTILLVSAIAAGQAAAGDWDHRPSFQPRHARESAINPDLQNFAIDIYRTRRPNAHSNNAPSNWSFAIQSIGHRDPGTPGFYSPTFRSPRPFATGDTMFGSSGNSRLSDSAERHLRRAIERIEHLTSSGHAHARDDTDGPGDDRFLDADFGSGFHTSATRAINPSDVKRFRALVPLPSAGLLAGAGLAGLIGLRRHRRI